jgi:sirohydrochlorin ferrochelatase
VVTGWPSLTDQPFGPVTEPARAQPLVLVGCSHGTRLPAGRRTMALLRLAIAKARPGIEVRAAHVDVHKPALDDVVQRFAAQGRLVVVVPLLLSTGYHVRVDIARAVAAAGPAAEAAGLPTGGPRAVAAAALGPDPVLVRVLQQRLTEAGAGPDDPVVLAAAGSSDPRASADVDQIVAALAELRAAPVSVGFLASAEPTVADAVALARHEHPGRQLAVATYLLAPGFFSGRLDAAGADRVAAPLAPHPDLADLALTRFDQALAALADFGAGQVAAGG